MSTPGLLYAQPGQFSDAQRYASALKRVTDVMLEDVTSPPAAARYYAYVTLAAYETLYGLGVVDGRFHAQVQRYAAVTPPPRKPGVGEAMLATEYALLRSGERLLPSGYRLRPALDSLRAAYASGAAATSALQWADSAIAHVLRFSGTDGFRRLSGLRRYTPVSGDAYWQPTPPGFLPPVEPEWRTVRTLLLPAITGFEPAPPAPYDPDPASAFGKLLKQVHDTCSNLTTEQQEIAMFWDCNPFAVQQIGHMEFGLKKISPGGHWMGIAGIVCRQQKRPLAQTAYVHAVLAATLHDAFVSCWDEKYRSNRIRPETAIQRLIDRSWRPLLQTPPFPEYTSGHSVISAAASEVLTALLGDGVPFDDDTEVEFGLPVRSFRSFRQAASEAGISRLYGGIHYMDAIVQGMEQGKRIGEFISGRLSSSDVMRTTGASHK